MNIVNEFVKQAMLRSFNRYPTRAHVLNHVCLTNDSGYHWVERYGFYVIEKIGAEGLEPAVMDTFEESLPRYLKKELKALDNPLWKANCELQNLVRTWAEKNIDIITMPEFKGYMHLLPSFTPSFTPSKKCSLSLMAKHPNVHEIHPHWFAAITEFAADVIEYMQNEVDENADVPDYMREELSEAEAVLEYRNKMRSIRVKRKDLVETTTLCRTWLSYACALDEARESA